jgi:hypothetical protein
VLSLSLSLSLFSFICIFPFIIEWCINKTALKHVWN